MRAMQKYRPTKTADGEYGYDESLGSADRIYGQVSWHDANLVLIHRGEADVDMEDVVEAADGAQYRVVGGSAPVGGGYAQARIERVEQPINTE